MELAADRGWHGNPVALGFTKILDRRIHGAVLLDQRLHDVVDRLEIAGIVGRQPACQVHDVVAHPGLCLGGDRHQELTADVVDIVDLDLDLFPGRPFLDQRFACGVGTGHKVVPNGERQPARRI